MYVDVNASKCVNERNNSKPLYQNWISSLAWYQTSWKMQLFFLPRVSKFICQNSLSFRGTKFWSEIEMELRKKVLTFSRRAANKIY